MPAEVRKRFEWLSDNDFSLINRSTISDAVLDSGADEVYNHQAKDGHG
jgi:hypothetical protein